MTSFVLQNTVIVLVKTTLRKKQSQDIKFEFHKEVFYDVYQKEIIVLKIKVLLLKIQYFRVEVTVEMF